MLPQTYNPDDCEGVRQDTLRDARIEIENAKHELEQTFVTFDRLADDREGIWTDKQREMLRNGQREVDRLVEVCDTNLEDIESELE